MTDTNGAVAEAKERIRMQMRRARRALATPERDRLAALVEERLLGLDGLRDAETILVFYSFGAEVETSGIVRGLHERGQRLLLPYLDAAGMQAAEVLAGDELLPTTYGPKEPPRRVPVDPVQVDAVVAPGLAFDRRGHRLGYGGGHYDRYLRRLGTRALRVGIGYSFQLVERLPIEPGDQPLDVIVTDSSAIRARA